jgi:hypothetical protein
MVQRKNAALNKDNYAENQCHVEAAPNRYDRQRQNAANEYCPYHSVQEFD